MIPAFSEHVRKHLILRQPRHRKGRHPLATLKEVNFRLMFASGCIAALLASEEAGFGLNEYHSFEEDLHKLVWWCTAIQYTEQPCAWPWEAWEGVLGLDFIGEVTCDLCKKTIVFRRALERGSLKDEN